MKKNTLTNNLENMKTKLVSYGIDTEIMQPEDAHYPPQSIVVNYGNPFTNWYGWN